MRDTYGGSRRQARRASVRLLAAATSLLLVVASLWTTTTSADAGGDHVVPLSSFPREQLVVDTRSARRHQFDAWRADTPETREQGLMFVREMRDDQAMIFVYEPPAYVAMWMKNTLIPLDMLFVDRYGCVVKVKHDARPGSLATISADAPIALVVELKGGIARALGIDTGDRVVRPDSNWPGSKAPCRSKR